MGAFSTGMAGIISTISTISTTGEGKTWLNISRWNMRRTQCAASLLNSKPCPLGESFGANTGQGWVLEKGTRLEAEAWITAMPKAR